MQYSSKQYYRYKQQKISHGPSLFDLRVFDPQCKIDREQCHQPDCVKVKDKRIEGFCASHVLPVQYRDRNGLTISIGELPVGDIFIFIICLNLCPATAMEFKFNGAVSPRYSDGKFSIKTSLKYESRIP